MCGIAGFCLNPHSSERLPAPAVISNALLLEIESRGKDSTGYAWASRTFTRIDMRKKAIRAKRFIETGNTNAIPLNAATGILHTRYATKGTPQNSRNNHPIRQGSVVGVHNGHLSNDDALFNHLNVERFGQVDSEAAMALIAHGQGHITERLPMLQGNAALAWLDGRDAKQKRGPILHLARVSSSPLAVGQTRGGSLLFASTMGLLHKACERLNVDLKWEWDCEEGTYLQVQGGKVTTFDTFTVPKTYARNVYSLPTRSFNYTPTPRTGTWSDTWEQDGQWLDDDTFVPYA